MSGMAGTRVQDKDGNDHIRYQRLVQVCNKALEESIRKLNSWERIQDCFPNYAQTREGTDNLAICQQQVIKLWSNLSRVEFDAIFHEREIREKLNQLDDLIEQAKLRQIPSENEELRRIDELKPTELIDGNLEGAKISTLKQLDGRLKKVTSMNKILEKELKQLNDNVFQELDLLQKAYEDVLNESTTVVDDTIRQAVNDMIIESREDS